MSNTTLPTNISTGWVAPHFAQLDFTNCTAATAWVAALYNGIHSSMLQEDIPASLTLDYLKSLVPSNWTTPTQTDLMGWYFEVLSNDKYASNQEFNATTAMMIRYPLQECTMDFCRKLDWGGDPDVYGIGVSLLRLV